MQRMFSRASSFSHSLCGAWSTSTADKTDMFVGSSGRLCTTSTSVFTTTSTSNSETSSPGLVWAPLIFMLTIDVSLAASYREIVIQSLVLYCDVPPLRILSFSRANSCHDYAQCYDFTRSQAFLFQSLNSKADPYHVHALSTMPYKASPSIYFSGNYVNL